MANSSLTVKLIDGSTVTWTLPISDWPDAKTYAQNIALNRGFWSDDGSWHPASAILSVTPNG